MAAKQPFRVLVTGAAGQIGYSIVMEIAKGGVFGHDQPIDLVLLDIPPMADVLEGVAMELADCALPTLHRVFPVTNEEEAFKDIDAAFLIGAMPRKEGMERKDLLAANVKIFKSQGQSLAKHAKKTVKVLVVGNPANTNALICAKYAAPAISPRQISAMTRLDHNRSLAQVAARCNVSVDRVKNVIIWGNHSATQVPDVHHAKVLKQGADQWVDAYGAINDEAWLHNEFVSLIQKRGAEIIKRRKLSSAMSAAKAACDHMRNWFSGTCEGEWVSMAVSSDGSYGIPEGIMYSFPVRICKNSKDWSIVQGLQIDDWCREKMNHTLKELEEEKGEALAACEH
jgi:malate dehydrogenase